MGNLSHNGQCFTFKGTATVAMLAGFIMYAPGSWYSHDDYQAHTIIEYADQSALNRLEPLSSWIQASHSKGYDIDIPAPGGLEYKRFQKAGIWYAKDLRSCLIADEMGLGKTVQALGVANLNFRERLLIICPASLRLNWYIEVKKWLMSFCPVEVYNSGVYAKNIQSTVITSYELAVRNYSGLIKRDFDLVIIDESHYVKTIGTKRSIAVLGDNNTKGLISIGKQTLLLSGTPMPNWPNEIYQVAARCAPQVLNWMTYQSFLDRYCHWFVGDRGIVVTRTKNESELGARLRGGFMVRREKADVLKDLPPKSYKLIVFPANKQTKRIIQREKQFSSVEIEKLSSLEFDTNLATLRKEMALAKVPLSVKYINELFSAGIKKLLVFGYHIESNKALFEDLRMYNPVLVIGGTSLTKVQSNVHQFQNDPNCGVFIGQFTAAGIGHNLTAAQDVYLHESSWSFAEDDQMVDRAHRIGQLGNVVVHLPVVEGSLDSKILSKSLFKKAGIQNVIKRRY